MATFKALVYADGKRKDGTFNVKIRITHRRETLKISTSLYVDKSQLTQSLKFKDARVKDATEDIVRRWRGYVTELGFRAEAMDVRQIVQYIKNKEAGKEVFRLDFIEYGNSILDRWPSTTVGNYKRALNSFERIIGPIDINDITPEILRRYERATLKTAPKGGGASYLQRLKAIYSLAQKQFNNPYAGEVKIPHSPFDYFEPTIKIEPAEKRAVPVEYIQRMIDLELDDKKEIVTRDLWLLSFGLAGVNVKDMTHWTKGNVKGNLIKYRREKIKKLGKRAEMEIRIEPQILPIYNRYIRENGDALFDFGYKALYVLSCQNLPKIAEKIGYEGILHQYSARHSWATIARNDCGIDMYDVNEGLVHVSREMKMTDVYIKREYTRVWEANKKVLELFDWRNVMK